MAKQLDLAQHANVFSDKAEGMALYNFMTPVLANISNLVSRINTRCINTPGLVIGTSSKKKVKLTNTILVSVGGVLATVAAATEVAFTATTHDIADGSTNIFALVADSAGAVTVLPGTAAATSGGIGGVVPPVIPTNRACIGFVVIATSGAIFDATSTDLDAVTLTVTYHDCVGPFDPKASITA